MPDDVAGAARLLGRPVTLIGRLTGGAHAVTTAVTDGVDEFVVRRFPPGDPAVVREVAVLPRLAPLGDLAPRLVACDDTAPDGPVIVTDRLRGGAPSPTADPSVLATQLAQMLARVHALSGTGLRDVLVPTGGLPGEMVLTHGDAWCGNALWDGDTLTGVVDWSGAGNGPRGYDVAWARLDLVLLGAPAAAEAFVAEYEARAGVALDDLAAFDRHAASRAAPHVETWVDNYAGIGRPEITGDVLRQRCDAWASRFTDQ